MASRPLHRAGKPLLVLKFGTILAIIAAIALHAAPATQATATFTVTKTADTADGSCDADCSLREAVIAANESPGDDTITLPPGTFLLTNNGSDGDNTAAARDLDITDNTNIAGAGARATIVDGNGAVTADRVFNIAAGASVTISGLTVSGGLAIAATGGGIRNSGNLILSHVKVAGNTSDQGGGIQNNGTLSIVRSLISGNQSTSHGGGIYNSGQAVLTNSTLAENTAAGTGADISNPGQISLLNVTIAGDASGVTTGLHNTGDAELRNTILASHNFCGAMTSQGHNLVQSGCTLTGPGDITNVPPLLGPLADNGGPTDTQALLAGSPAIDAGDDAGCPAEDQRGRPRPADGDGDGAAACDIGAYEAAAAGVAPGDADCDGGVDAVDALQVLRSVADLPNPAECVAAGNVKCDDPLNAVDALLILRYVAQLPVALPDGCPEIGT